MDTLMPLEGIESEGIPGEPFNQAHIEELCETVFSGCEASRYFVQLLNALKKHDEYTFKHSVNVGLYSMFLAGWLELPDEEIFEATQAGLLHDIGKMTVDRQVLNKTDGLTREEFEKIQLHTVSGFNLLKNAKGISCEVKNTVLMHHERENGSGYPFHSESRRINLYTKIVAVTDVFDAMTSDRVYRKGLTAHEAYRMFQTEGLKLFDASVMNTFFNNLFNLKSEIWLPAGLPIKS